ncbi:glycoside hydrolase [Fulvivirga ulvae]|uniref:sialidase family protein n=1 Tax=Fulvivirga ulvae TaxID=2904245 RepID=UPI001F2A0A50|nr:sialidase family protein [Fulvivirga ulvae]UII34299.1 glycoside hydrolase [Fulvivirga ulvae]
MKALISNTTLLSLKVLMLERYNLLFICIVYLFSISCTDELDRVLHDPNDTIALHPPSIYFNINDSSQNYLRYTNRLWQGIPSIERTKEGVLWAVWYSGDVNEGTDNYVTVSMSKDDGLTWQKNAIIIEPEPGVRAFDPTIWYSEKDQHLYIFWTQSYEFWDGRGGVWYIRSPGLKSEEDHWSTPRRIYDGVMINKPIQLLDERILLPVSIWGDIYPGVHHFKPPHPEIQHKAGVNVVSTTDFNKFHLESIIKVPKAIKEVDEPQLVEIDKNVIHAILRTKKGTFSSTSFDNGYNWSPLSSIDLQPTTNSRSHIKKLRSGNFLFVQNNSLVREKLTVYLSRDKMKSWESLIIDERMGVSYPDVAEGENGNLYAIYDRSRSYAKEIILCRFNEKDIITGNKNGISCSIIDNAR